MTHSRKTYPAGCASFVISRTRQVLGDVLRTVL